MVARLHFSGNPDEIAEWLRSLVAHNISTEKFQTDGVNKCLFKGIGMNDKKIKCFWNRFTGVTLVEMTRRNLDPSPLDT